MNSPRSLAIALALALSACGTTQGKLACDSKSCPTGCCNPTSGRCETGTTTDQCGSAGASCSTCTTGQVCLSGICSSPNGTGGGSASAGGTTAGGSTGGGASAGGSAVGGGAAAMPTWYRDVLPITQVSCANCHKMGGIGPFPLQTYAQAQPIAAAMKAAVVAKRMPPWMPDNSCGGPFVGDRSLSQTQIDTIARWADTGATEGNPADAPAAPGPIGELPRIDATLTMPEPYTPSQTLTDDYRCFLVDPALTANRFVVGYDIQPGVTAEVHHVIVYIVDRAAARTKDMNDQGPGWQCFGDSGLQSTGPIGAWAPGSGAVVYPSGTGIELQPSQALAMQIHYNTATTRVPDTSAVKVMYSPAGASLTRAYLLPLVANGFAIPPNSTGYSFTDTFQNPTRVLPIKIYGLLPHMHTLGKRITIRGPSNQCLVDIPAWDFHWQQQYFRAQPFTLAGTESVSMTCTWDNPTNRVVRWGEGTADEMCFAYIYATP